MKTLIQLILIGLLIMCFSRCNVIKAKRSTKATVDSVSRKSASVVDTGSGGSRSASTSKETFDWSKLTIQYPPGDTNVTIINNYPQKPATVIYETGHGAKEETRTDSTWFRNALSAMQNSVDSLHMEISQRDKDKQTTPSIWFYVAVFAAVLVCWKGIGLCWTWLTGKYHILMPKSKA